MHAGQALRSPSGPSAPSRVSKDVFSTGMIGVGCRSAGIDGERCTEGVEGEEDEVGGLELEVEVEAAYANGSRGTPHSAHLGRASSLTDAGLL